MAFERSTDFITLRQFFEDMNSNAIEMKLPPSIVQLAARLFICGLIYVKCCQKRDL